jgi:hypothetical protein
MTIALCILAGICAVIIAARLIEIWRTRKDKGYDASKWGAL